MSFMVKMTDIYKHIYEYKGWNNADEKNHLPVLEKKYRQLLKTITPRDISYYKYRTGRNIENHIPEMDVPIVTELIIRASPGKGHDTACSQWFNGSLGHDYQKIATLFKSLIHFLDSLKSTDKIDDITYAQWEAAIDTSLCGTTAIRILEMNEAMNNWFDVSKVLNHNLRVDTPYYINSDKEHPVIFHTPPDDYYIYDKPLSDMMKYMTYQEDFIGLMTAIWQVMYIESLDKAEKLISIIVEELKEGKKIDINSRNRNLPNESLSFAYSVYQFLKNNPESCNAIKQIVDAEDLIDYFKLIDDDDDRFKNDAKMKTEDSSDSN